MSLFGLHICSIAIVICHGFKTKICTRLLLISNLIIKYSDFAIQMVIQKLGFFLFLYFICSYKNVKKKKKKKNFGHLDFVGFEPISWMFKSCSWFWRKPIKPLCYLGLLM